MTIYSLGPILGVSNIYGALGTRLIGAIAVLHLPLLSHANCMRTALRIPLRRKAVPDAGRALRIQWLKRNSAADAASCARQHGSIEREGQGLSLVDAGLAKRCTANRDPKCSSMTCYPRSQSPRNGAAHARGHYRQQISPRVVCRWTGFTRAVESARRNREQLGVQTGESAREIRLWSS